MSVISLTFLCFFPIVVLLYYILPKRFRRIWLLVVSYYFYMSWGVKYGFVLLWITMVSYCGALGISGLDRLSIDEKVRMRLKKGCVFSLAVMVFGTLFLSKFFIFAIGASFYSFQSFGYIMDVYRKKTEPERNFLIYALFLSFFPTVVSGPIERSSNLLRQLQSEEQTVYREENIKQGLCMMLWGYFMRLVIAERIAQFVNLVYDQNLGGVYAITATILYGIQIYCDFAGYSTIAMGTARTLGFAVTENFAAPYLAATVSEFWRRWHISLSEWFRDYLYIPLGGNRKGRVRKYVNILIVFSVSGIWHGNSWKYIIWGGLHGFYQVAGEVLMPVKTGISRLFRLGRKQGNGKIYRFLQSAVTFLLVDFAWIFFRADSTRKALKMIKAMAAEFDVTVLWDGSLYNYGIGQTEFGFLVLLLLLLVLVDLLHYHKRYVLDIIREWHWMIRTCLCACMLMAVIIFGVYGVNYDVGSFIYFAF